MIDIDELVERSKNDRAIIVGSEIREAIQTLHAERDDAIARVVELADQLKAANAAIKILSKNPDRCRCDVGYECGLHEILRQNETVLSLPTLGAAERLRDEVLEEAANIGYNEALQATECVSAALRVRGAIRAAKKS